MIEIKKDLVLIEFKNGPALNDAENCVRLAMEILNMSKVFSSVIEKGSKPGKKTNKTRRIRVDIQKFVNKTNVTPMTIDSLICSMRRGRINRINAKIGDNEIMLYPDNDVPGIIARLMVERVI